MKRLARLALIATCLAAPACAAIARGYDIAPSGLSRPDDRLRRTLARGGLDSAAAWKAVSGEAAPRDDLLRLLYEGIVAYHGGDPMGSVQALDRAAELAEDRYTKSISRAGLSLLTSDLVLPYEPGRTERLMIPYYAALGWLAAGNIEEAAVEARRIGQLLEAQDGEPRPEDRRLHAFLRYFAGAIFEAAGETNDAAVAYRNARLLAGESLPPDPYSTDAPSERRRTGDGLGEVLVVVEEGFVAHRAPQSVVVVLHPEEAKALSGGEREERTVVAAAVAARVVAYAFQLSANTAQVRSPADYRRTLFVPQPDTPAVQLREKERRCETRTVAPGAKTGQAAEKCEEKDDDEDDATAYPLHIAWPIYVREPTIPGPIVVRTGDAELPLTFAADLSDPVIADFEAERPLRLARMLARAAAKFALTRSLEKSAAKKDEGLGHVVGLIAGVSSAVLEQADTRCWHLLPGRAGLLRLRLPAGRHTLHVVGPDGTDRPLDVDVRPGRLTIVSTRIW